jgi:beta-mannanase
MKTVLIRISLFLLVLLLSSGLVTGLILAGEKTRGPLDDFLTTVGTGVARLEHQIVSEGQEKSRSTRLRWLDRYRRDRDRLARPDTLLVGAYDNHTTTSFDNIVALEDSLRTRLAIIHFYTAWGGKKEQTFPSLRLQAIHDLGSIPMVTWEPWLDDFDREVFPASTSAAEPNKGGLQAIAAGAYDAYIDKWARQAQKFGAPFFLRLGHEMNDPYRYPWGPHNNPPADYIAAWRHVVDRFRAAGATNVLWVWSPHPAYPPYDIFYPGDEYVDWVGLTALNYGAIAAWSKWWTFDEIVGPSYHALATHNKPLLVTEFGTLNAGGSRAEWFGQALTDLPKVYPAVKAVVFFHSSRDQTSTYEALDWSFVRDTAVLGAIRGAVKGWRR